MANIIGVAYILRKLSTHESRYGSVLVRSSNTEHNIHSQMNLGTSTPVSLGGGCVLGPRWRIRHDISQSPIQPAARGAQPLNPSIRAPLLLESLTTPVVYASGNVQRPAVSEVQPGIHAGSLA